MSYRDFPFIWNQGGLFLWINHLNREAQSLTEGQLCIPNTTPASYSFSRRSPYPRETISELSASLENFLFVYEAEYGLAMPSPGSLKLQVDISFRSPEEVFPIESSHC